MSNATRPDAIKRLAIKTKAASFDEWQAAAAAVASLGLEEFDEPRSIVSVPFSPTTLKHQNHRKATRLSLRDKLGMPRAFGEEMEAKLGKAIKEFHERQVKIGSGTEHYLKGSKGRRPTWSESDGFNLPCKEIDELINLSKHSSKWENDPQRCWWRSPSHARASSGSCLGRQQSFTGLVTTSRKSRSSSRIIKRRHSFNGFPTTSELVNRSMLPDLREFFDHQYRIALLRKKMHDKFEETWGDSHGNEVLYWQRRIEVVELFSAIDLDGDGNLDREELKAAFHMYHVHAKQLDVDHLMSILDTGGDGDCDIEEFSEWYRSDEDDWTLGRRKNDSDVGGMDKYSDQRLLERQSLCFDANVRAAIDAFWKVINWEEDQDTNIEVDTSKVNKSFMVSEAEYIEFNINLQRHVAEEALKEDSDESEDEVKPKKKKNGGGKGSKRKKAPKKGIEDFFDENRALMIAEREWEFDSEGQTEIGYDDFFMSMFQLVDAWAERIDVSSFTGFLEILLKGTTTIIGKDARGRPKRGWKWLTGPHAEELSHQGFSIDPNSEVDGDTDARKLLRMQPASRPRRQSLQSSHEGGSITNFNRRRRTSSESEMRNNNEIDEVL